MRGSFLLAVFGIALSLAACSKLAPTATLHDVRGEVLVGAEGHLQRASNAVAVNAGGVVVTRSEARAIIAYDDGCRVKIEPGSLVTVALVSPCAMATQRSPAPQR